MLIILSILMALIVLGLSLRELTIDGDNYLLDECFIYYREIKNILAKSEMEEAKRTRILEGLLVSIHYSYEPEDYENCLRHLKAIKSGLESRLTTPI